MPENSQSCSPKISFHASKLLHLWNSPRIPVKFQWYTSQVIVLSLRNSSCFSSKLIDFKTLNGIPLKLLTYLCKTLNGTVLKVSLYLSKPLTHSKPLNLTYSKLSFVVCWFWSWTLPALCSRAFAYGQKSTFVVTYRVSQRSFPLLHENNSETYSLQFQLRKEFGIFARRAMVDQAREGLCYQWKT